MKIIVSLLVFFNIIALAQFNTRALRNSAVKNLNLFQVTRKDIGVHYRNFTGEIQRFNVNNNLLNFNIYGAAISIPIEKSLAVEFAYAVGDYAHNSDYFLKSLSHYSIVYYYPFSPSLIFNIRYSLDDIEVEKRTDGQITQFNDDDSNYSYGIMFRVNNKISASYEKRKLPTGASLSLFSINIHF